MVSLFWAFLLLGVLILVHEFGHYITAKLTGVKVLRFSIGFGPKIVGFKAGETEYWIAAFPLGGYVKLLAQEPSEEIPEGEEKRAFVNAPLWVRFLIVFAGPAFSILFPILIYFPIYLGVGELYGTRVGQVFEGTPAYNAGILPGDTVRSYDGEETLYWDDMAVLIQGSWGRSVEVEIEREGAVQKIQITPEKFEFKDKLGDDVVIGQIGIAADAVPAAVGPVGEDSPAYRAGVRSGDRVLKAAGREVKFYYELDRIVKNALAGGSSIELQLQRKAEVDDSEQAGSVGENAELSEPFMALIEPERLEDGSYYYGLVSADVIVGKVDEGSPAAMIGIQPGDVVKNIDGKTVSSWTVIEKELRSKLDAPIELEVMRGKEKLVFTFAQKKEEVKAEYNQMVTRYRFGAWSALPYAEWLKGELVKVDGRLGFATVRAVKTLIDITYQELVVLGKLFSGQLSFKMVGGPLLIFDVAGTAAKSGIEEYLWMMALISINLGLINLLPVPILDGGHLMFFSIEAVLRKPVNRKLKERATMAGFFLIMLLMVLVIKNDIERYWENIIAWFS